MQMMTLPISKAIGNQIKLTYGMGDFIYGRSSGLMLGMYWGKKDMLLSLRGFSPKSIRR